MDVVRQPVKPKHNNITNYFLVTATSVLQLYYASAIKYLNTNERVVCSFVLCRFLWTHSVYTAFMHQFWTVRYKSFFFLNLQAMYSWIRCFSDQATANLREKRLEHTDGFAAPNSANVSTVWLSVCTIKGCKSTSVLESLPSLRCKSFWFVAD